MAKGAELEPQFAEDIRDVRKASLLAWGMSMKHIANFNQEMPPSGTAIRCGEEVYYVISTDVLKQGR